MKKQSFFFLISLLAGSLAAGRAEAGNRRDPSDRMVLGEARPKKALDSGGFYDRLTPYLAVEHFVGGNPYDGESRRLEALRPAFVGFFGDFDYTLSGAKTGNGVRAGVTYSGFMGSRIDWGGNFSWVEGPDAHGTAQWAEFRDTLDYRLRYIQFMLDGSRKFRAFGGGFLKLGLGAGIGNGEMRVDERVVDSTSGNQVFSDEFTRDWWAVTYDAQAALGWDVGRFVLEGGIRYTQFPRLKGETNQPEVKWAPVSLFFSLGF